MALYRIWSRVSEVGPGQYLAVVAAIPADALPEARHESESRLLSSRALAEAASQEMQRALAGRLTARGHSVSSSSTV